MKKTRIAIITAFAMLLIAVAMVSCGKNKTKKAEKPENAPTATESSANAEVPETITMEEVTTEKKETEDIKVDEETGELVVNVESDNVELVEGDNGEKAVIITDDKTGEKTTIAVKEGSDGKIVVDNSKQASVDTKTGEVKVTDFPKPVDNGSEGTTTTETKVVVDNQGNVNIVTEKTVTVTVTPTPTTGSSSSSTPTSAAKQVTPTTAPALTSKPTATPVPTKAPTSTPVPTSTPKPTATTAPTPTTAPATCSHTGHVYMIYTKKIIAAYDEEVMVEVQTSECRGCGQYSRDFIEAYNAHDTAKLVELMNVGQSQKAIDNLNKFVAENPNWIYENYESGGDFFVDHCGGCHGGSSWGTVYINVPTGEVIHHDAEVVAGNFIGQYCTQCNTWLFDDSGSCAALAKSYGITEVNSNTCYMKKSW